MGLISSAVKVLASVPTIPRSIYKELAAWPCNIEGMMARKVLGTAILDDRDEGATLSIIEGRMYL